MTMPWIMDLGFREKGALVDSSVYKQQNIRDTIYPASGPGEKPICVACLFLIDDD
jgi:hypothetical protein